MRTSVLRNAHLFCARKKPGDSLSRLDGLFEPDLNAASFPSLRKRCQLPGIRTPCTRNGSRFSQSSRCPHPPQGCRPVSLLMPDATASPTRSTPLALAPDGANAGQIDSRQTLHGIRRGNASRGMWRYALRTNTTSPGCGPGRTTPKALGWLRRCCRMMSRFSASGIALPHARADEFGEWRTRDEPRWEARRRNWLPCWSEWPVRVC